MRRLENNKLLPFNKEQKIYKVENSSQIENIINLGKNINFPYKKKFIKQIYELNI